MGSVQARAKGLESTISVLILIVLAIIGLGVFLKQSSYDISKFGVAPVLSDKAEKQTTTEKELLRSVSLAGFVGGDKVEVYTADNLYEKIDGKADFYLSCGFVRLLSRQFIDKVNSDLWLEIYVFDMGQARNAFSVYSRQHRPKAKSVENIAEGYQTSNALYFCRGRYYIELVGSDESTELSRAATELALKIQSALAVGDVKIAEKSLLPKEGLVQTSMKLYIAGTFGFEGLTETIVAGYRIEGHTTEAFVSRQATAGQAKQVALAYKRFLLDNGCKDTESADAKFSGCVMNCYGLTEIVLAKGPFVIGVHEGQDTGAAEKLVVRLINYLEQIDKQ